MAGITSQAQQLINRSRLGNPLEVYGPPTFGRIIGGLFFLAFGLAWFLVVGTLLANPFVPTGLVPISSQELMQMSPENDGIASFIELAIPLVGLLFSLIAFVLILRAIANRQARVVVCVAGLAYLTSRAIDTVRWEQIKHVAYRKDVRTSTSYNASTHMSTTSTSVRHRYTIHCYDGRAFLLDSNLFGGRVRKLARTIEARIPRGQQR